MDSTVTYLAIPSLSASLNPTGSELLWITDMYTFMEGGFLIIMGALGDKVGRKRLLLFGFIAFSIASVMAAFSDSPELLILARALLGVTGAIILPCTLSIIRGMFTNDKQRAFAFGIYTACYASGTTLGPLLGGILLTYFWWGSVFLISVPLMVVFLMASSWLPEYRDPAAKQFSVVSAILLLTGTLLLVYGIKHGAETLDADWITAATILCGTMLCIAFVFLQKRIENPLVDVNLFKIPVFSATLSTLFVSLFCWSGLYLFVTQYLQLVLSLSPMIAGLLTVLPAAITMVGCMLAPQLLKWMNRTSVILMGNVIMLVGMLMLTQIGVSSALMYIVIACSCLSAGCGFIVAIGIEMVVSSAPSEQAGAASGISETSTTFGSAFGVALLGSIGTAIYHQKMLRSPFISQTNVVDAANTLGSAVEISANIRTSDRTVLLDTAKSAFISSFHVASFAGAAMIALMIIVFAAVMVRLRK
jgi:DHA2 family multidrug resistance protein-like MFS transporter